MSKNVVILTQPLHTNYGGTLQAFALQKVIYNLGFQVETLNYQPKKISAIRKSLFSLKKFILSRELIFPYTEKEIAEIKKYHDLFIKNNINFSKRLDSVQQLKSYILSKNISSIVVGSDQVWRPAYSPRIESFFLDFLKNNSNIKKISYAASFGVENWEYSHDQTLLLKELIFYFDYISVREDAGVSLCKKYLNVDAELVLDPTLLLKKDDYIQLSKNLKSNNKDKIFSYLLDRNEKKDTIVGEISKNLTKDVFSTFPKHKSKNKLFISEFDDYIFPPIEVWLKSFEDASFVVTDSFHGMVFSIIYNKPFIAIVNEERGASRFTSLLKILNLENRLIYDTNCNNFDIIFQGIDFPSINSQLDSLRSEFIARLSKELL